jgi:hypothetical protein
LLAKIFENCKNSCESFRETSNENEHVIIMPDDKINVIITPIEKKNIIIQPDDNFVQNAENIIIQPDEIIYVIIQQDIKPQYEIINVTIYSYNF